MGAVGESWAVESRSVKSTQGLARKIASAMKPGKVLGLTGDLGAGKTAFVQGLASGLGVEDLTEVVSPTYALVNEYAGPVPLVHIDLYRLDEPTEIRALGIQEQLERQDAVAAVEWADHVPEVMPAETIWIRISGQGQEPRRIEVQGMEKPKGIRLSSVD